ncbi:MAG TPA: hypothetical protein VFH61_12770 [Thermoleophilia bacterium]|nr:hypothetical protein [Thermoleophilia bacterium]
MSDDALRQAVLSAGQAYEEAKSARKTALAQCLLHIKGVMNVIGNMITQTKLTDEYKNARHQRFIVSQAIFDQEVRKASRAKQRLERLAEALAARQEQG